MSDPGGRRLTKTARREQLVAAGLALVRDRAFDQIGADDVAAAAGVSKALVFHYFPNTRELHAAILEAATAELVASLDVDPSASPAERLRLGVDAFIAYIERSPGNYLAMARSSGSDPALGAVLERTRAGVVAIVQGVVGAPELPDGLAIGLRGWIAFVEEATLHWLARGQPIERDALVDLLHRTAVVLLPEALALPERRDR